MEYVKAVSMGNVSYILCVLCVMCVCQKEMATGNLNKDPNNISIPNDDKHSVCINNITI